MTSKKKLVQGVKTKITELTLKFSLFFFNCFNRIKSLIKKITHYLAKIFITLLVIAVYIYLFISGITINEGDRLDYSTFFITIGSTLITILILTYSIAILPIQRSIEFFSKSISFIYRNDKPTSIIFILISIFALLSFLFSLNVNFFGSTVVRSLMIIILLIGITLDLLRWYHRRITILLEPENAIQTLTNKTKKYINKYQSKTYFFSKWSYRFLKRMQSEEITVKDIEKMIFLTSNRLDLDIVNKFSELTEISIKSLTKHEINTVTICLNALAETGTNYVKVRKDNLIYYPSKAANYLVSESTIDNVLNNLYENILTIAQKSNLVSNQNSSITCIKVIAKVTDSIAKYILSDDIPESKDMFFVPIDYMAKVIEDAQNKNLDEVVLQGCELTSQTLSNIYNKRHIIELDYKVNKLYINLVINYIITDKQVYSNKVLENMLGRLTPLVNNHSDNLNYTLKDILEKLQEVFPLALLAVKKKQNNLMYFDLSVPYDMANENSFVHFIRSTVGLIKKVEDKPFVNPYHNFLMYDGEVCMHFRFLGEHYDLGNSVFLWHITFSIKEIIKIHFDLLKEPLTNVKNYLDEIFGQISWYLSFFWSAYTKASILTKNYTDDVCDVICWTALSCYRDDFYNQHIIDIHKVINTCISDLSSVIKDYIKKGESRNSYDIADLVLYLWFIRIVAVSKKENFRIVKIDNALNELGLNPDQQAYIDEALKLRYQQFLERVLDKRTYSIYDVDKSIGLLKELVKDESFFII